MIYKWGELIALEYGKPIKDKARTDGQYPVYGTNGQIGTSNLTPLCDHPSFILGRKGAYRGVHYSSVPFSVIDTAFYAVNLHPDILDIKWAYYRFLTYDINSMDSGSAIPSTDRYEIYAIEVDLPDIDEQKREVKLLECFDDKIANITEINDNLQQQVQTLFADWLSANSGSATEVALGDVCTKVTDGSHFSPKDDPTSSIPMLSVKDMREFDFDLTSCKHICEDDYEKMVANDCVPQINDILVAKDGSYLKEIFICNEQRKLAILSSIAIFRPNATVIHPEILLAFLKSPRVLREVRDNYVSGSALPRIVLKDFKKLTFALPNMDAQNLIAPLFASIREQIDVNVAENKYMAQLRDALLPKLMSGELNISKIDL